MSLLESGAVVHASATMVFTTEGRVLIGREPEGKPRARMLTLPVGKWDVKADGTMELPKEAAKRELEEEAGVSCELDHLSPVRDAGGWPITVTREYDGVTSITHLFMVHSNDVFACGAHVDNLVDLQMVSKSELRELVLQGEGMSGCLEFIEYAKQVPVAHSHHILAREHEGARVSSNILEVAEACGLSASACSFQSSFSEGRIMDWRGTFSRCLTPEEKRAMQIRSTFFHTSFAYLRASFERNIEYFTPCFCTDGFVCTHCMTKRNPCKWVFHSELSWAAL